MSTQNGTPATNVANGNGTVNETEVHNFEEVKNVVDFTPNVTNGTEGMSAPAESAPVKKSRFGVSKDTQSAAGIPINAPIKLEKRTEIFPNGYEFPVGRLVKVHFNPAKETKNNPEPVPVVEFVFATSKGKKFTHIEFPIDEDDQNFDKKLENLNQRIKHIFDETIGVNHFKEGSMEGDSFSEFFSNVTNAFNSVVITKDEKEYKLHTINDVYIKLTYYKDRLNFSQFPNFVQRATSKGAPIVCELLINPKYDNIEPSASPSGGAGGYTPPAATGGFGSTGGFAGGDFPDFPG